jgi:phage baseplate assembly protein gpV
MKRLILTTAAICAALLVISPAALAAYIWNGNNGYEWCDSDNWDTTGEDSGYPDSRDAIVTIPDGIVWLDCDPNVGQLTITEESWLLTDDHTLTVNTSGKPTGRLVIDPNSVLVIEPEGRVYLNNGTDHQVAGYIWLLPEAILHFGGDARISPYNSIDGVIEGWDDETSWITVASGKTLVNNIQIMGSLQIQAGGATFINDGIVEANHESGGGGRGITCFSGAFEGNDDAYGTYRVSDSFSTLQFAANTATGLESDFEVTAGKLEIDIDVWTSGDLTFTGGTIKVADGVSFKTNQ